MLWACILLPHLAMDAVLRRLPEDSGERLHRMGLHTLAALRALPRDGLRRRFGPALLEHLDRLYGQADDPLDWYAPPDHFDARVEMGYEVENHMALLFPLRRLVGDLCTYLSIRDGGVQRFVLRLEHEQGHSDVEVGLLAPERNQALLFELARNRLERVAIDRPVVGLRLLARQLPPFVPAVRDLFDTRPQQALDWPQLRERLRARLGDAAVYRVEPAGDPRPEKAWRRALGDAPTRGVETAPARPPRPAWLLAKPVPLLTRQHRPFYGTPLRMVSPGERIEGGWQDGQTVTRDYFVAEDDNGICYWIYKERPTASDESEARFFLHGLFG